MYLKLFSMFIIMSMSNAYAALDSLDGGWVLKSDGQEVARITEDGLEVIGAMKLPTISVSCSSSYEGVMRYNAGVVEICDGTSWTEISYAADGAFFLSETTYDGNLGGRSGADALCLTELTSNTWIGKTDYTLNSSTVKAFLTGDELIADREYSFETVGSLVVRSARTFTTDSSGLGPNEIYGWSATSTFDVSDNFWSDVGTGTDNTWSVGTLSSCNGFTDNTMSYSGTTGDTAGLGTERWQDGSNSFCTATHRLICVVNPVE